MKLHNYDLVVMGNICFKFQLDQMYGLAARFINFFDRGFFVFLIFILKKAHLTVPVWV